MILKWCQTTRIRQK